MKHDLNFFIDLIMEDQRPQEAEVKNKIHIPWDRFIFAIALLILGFNLL